MARLEEGVQDDVMRLLAGLTPPSSWALVSAVVDAEAVEAPEELGQVLDFFLHGEGHELRALDQVVFDRFTNVTHRNFPGGPSGLLTKGGACIGPLVIGLPLLVPLVPGGVFTSSCAGGHVGGLFWNKDLFHCSEVHKFPLKVGKYTRSVRRKSLLALELCQFDGLRLP